jgi:hypothetical protein
MQHRGDVSGVDERGVLSSSQRVAAWSIEDDDRSNAPCRVDRPRTAVLISTSCWQDDAISFGAGRTRTWKSRGGVQMDSLSRAFCTIAAASSSARSSCSIPFFSMMR